MECDWDKMMSFCEKKRLLFIANRGTLIHRLPVVLAAAGAGYEVHVACPDGHDLFPFEQSGIRLHPFTLNRSNTSLLSQCRLLLNICKLYKSIQPDLVQLMTVKLSLWGSIGARIIKIPGYVSALTGLGYLYSVQSFKIRLLRNLVNLGLRVAFSSRRSRVIFQNPDDMDYFVKKNILSSQRAVLIRGSGVDIQQFLHKEEENSPTPIIMLAARMLWSKGVGEFVQAAKILKQQNVNVRFVLVGAEDIEAPDSVSQYQLNEWDQEGTVEYWGPSRNMAATLSLAHIVCLPSYYREGVPKVLLEAASCGRPIITTDAPGCREIVRHGINGFLIPPRDAHALVAAIQQLVQNPVVRKNMGVKGREIVENEFSVNQVCFQTLAVYQGLLLNEVQQLPADSSDGGVFGGV